MKTGYHKLLLLGLIILVTFVACAKTHVITTNLERPLANNQRFVVTEMEDQLPFDTKVENKPTAQELMTFQGYLVKELRKQYLVASPAANHDAVPYQLRGAVLSYKAGNGFLRFLFGEFAGAAKLTVSLELFDNVENQIVFAGNFTQKITSWLETRDEMYKRIAKDFAKTLKKQREILSGGKIDDQKVSSSGSEFN